MLPPLRRLLLPLPFLPNHLPQGMHNLQQIRLRRHHGFNG